MVLTAVKGVALIVIDREMFIEKCMTLLNDEEVYHECRNETQVNSFQGG